MDPAVREGNRSETYQNVNQANFLLQNLPVDRDYRKIPPNKPREQIILYFAVFAVGSYEGQVGWVDYVVCADSCDLPVAVQRPELVATHVDSVADFPDNAVLNRLIRSSTTLGNMFMAGAALVFTDGNFQADVLESPGVALVDFWAPWCGPCVRLGPTIDELATEYAGKAKIGKLNVDENSLMASSYGITSIPCMIIFKDGKPAEKLVGLVSKAVIATAIDKAMKA